MAQTARTFFVISHAIILSMLGNAVNVQAEWITAGGDGTVFGSFDHFTPRKCLGGIAIAGRISTVRPILSECFVADTIGPFDQFTRRIESYPVTAWISAIESSAHGLCVPSWDWSVSPILAYSLTGIRIIDGELRIGWQLLLPVLMAGGVVFIAGFVWIARLRREVIRSDEQRVESEAKFRTLFNESTNAILVTSDDGIIVQANNAAIILLESGETDSMIGSSISRFVDVGSNGTEERIPRAILKSADGAKKFVEIHTITVATETQWHLRDLTTDDAEKKRIQQVAAIEAMGLMAGSVAHDMRNMLGIIGLTNKFLESKVSLDDGLRDGLERSQAAVKQGAELAEKLMKLGNASEAEALVPTDVVEIAEEVHRSFSSHEQVRCETEFSEQRVWAMGHPELILRTFVNIYSNALQSIEDEGTVLLTVKKGGMKVGGKPSVEISIADTGKGIPLDVQHRVFDPYFTTKHDSGGTGLGLQSARSAIESMGGEITLKSEIGKGTTITILLEETNSRPKTESVEGTKQRILVVDDDERVQRSNALILTLAGFEVVSTARSEEAGDYLTNEQFDVLVTDLMMEPLTGLDLTDIAKEHQTDCHVILVTGYEDILLQRDSIQDGVIDKVFSKPLRARDFVSHIQNRQNTPSPNLIKSASP